MKQQSWFSFENQNSQVIHPTLPIHSPRIEHIPLSGLIQSEINQQTTLIIPPIEKMKPNKLMYEKLALLAKGNTDLRIV